MAENLEQLYSDALAAHGQGDLNRAEQLYRQILAADANYADAAQYLGLVAAQRGQFDIAEPLFAQTVKAHPDQPEAHFNLGVARQAMGRGGEALASYEAAIALRPDYLEAVYNRGVLLQDMARQEDAIVAYDAVLQLNPYSVEALSNRGAALHALKRYDESLSSYDKALAVQPAFVQTLHNRGLLLSEMGRHQDALASFDRALALQPGHIDALTSRGKTLHALGRLDEALTCYARALALQPGYPGALYSRALTLRSLGRMDEALGSHDRAIASAPNSPQMHYGRGVLLLEMGRLPEALSSYNHALALQPHFVPALKARAALLTLAREYGAAADDLQTLLRFAPEMPYALGELVHAQMNGCEWRDLELRLNAIAEGVGAGKRVCQPFYSYVASSSSDEQLRCAEIYAADLYPPSAQPVWRGERYAHDKIRLAYLSGDFHEHATAALVAELFERHDRTKFEVVGVSFGPDDQSSMRKRLIAAFDRFLDVRNKSDRAVAEELRALEIDIAVDLKGYGTGSRAGIFAERFAPAQVNYLVNPGTMGAPYFDYLIADATLIPPGRESHYSEKVVRLPDSYQVNDSKRGIAQNTPSRAELGLPETGFVFCCFNNNYKITPDMFDVWMRLLRDVEGSVLWLLEGNGAVKANLQREAQARGIAGERIVFAPRTGLPEHLARHRAADLFLDTLPCNAHTTASDALWAGLPVLTVEGQTFAGRVAASLLRAAGLPELVCDSLQAYEARARELAQSASAITALKAKLSAGRASCALFDTDRMRRHIEAAFIEMAARAARGEPLQSFDVKAV